MKRKIWQRDVRLVLMCHPEDALQKKINPPPKKTKPKNKKLRDKLTSLFSSSQRATDFQNTRVAFCGGAALKFEEV